MKELILSESEEGLLQLFNENELLKDSLKKILNWSVNNSPVDLNKNNEDLGAQVRAKEEAEKMIEEAFKKIGEYRKAKAPVQEKNPGR